MIDIESIWNTVDELTDSVEKSVEIIREDPDFCKKCKTHGNINQNVCMNCGLTSNNWIDEGAEWRSGVSEDGIVHDPCRVGMAQNPLYSSDWGKGTVMNVKRHQAKKYRLASIINYHGGMNHKDRALHKAYADFDRAAANLKVNGAIVNMAKMLYKKFTEETLTRGKVRTGIKANCLFFACKNQGVPRSTQEVAAAFEIDTKDISRTFDKAKDSIRPTQTKITKPSDMIPRIFNNLGIVLDRAMGVKKMKCVKICDKLMECPKLMSKTPLAVAAVVVMQELQLSRAEAARVSGISVATISKIEAVVKAWESS
jgi:transcription initiation factor TFIIB